GSRISKLGAERTERPSAAAPRGDLAPGGRAPSGWIRASPLTPIAIDWLQQRGAGQSSDPPARPRREGWQSPARRRETSSGCLRGHKSPSVSPPAGR
uniref:Uncharacterized protein n=1 Tax=Apteryx owenii TaxID=8824 RepID=A0A8B9QTP5_APTOW